LALLRETTWEEIGEESLNGTKDKYMPHRGQWDQKDDHNWNKGYKIFEGSSVYEK